MGIGVSIFLIALGAILFFATNVDLAGIDINTVGIILMVVGAIGLLWSLIAMGTRGGTRRTVIDDDPRGPL
jgi:hypothetical protein